MFMFLKIILNLSIFKIKHQCSIKDLSDQSYILKHFHSVRLQGLEFTQLKDCKQGQLMVLLFLKADWQKFKFCDSQKSFLFGSYF